MDNIWYYEYAVKSLDIDDKIVECHGIVPGESFSDAVVALEHYYQKDLVEITKLKELVEGPVLEFQLINDEEDIDFYISKKSKGENV